MRLNVIFFPIATIALLVATWMVYHQGLRGGFLFDDYANLPVLGALGPVDNWPSFWRYVTSGTADPTGRPLSLLTFLLDAQNWPADPYPFKRSNLILHILNAALLALLLRNLGRATLNDERKTAYNTGLLAENLYLRIDMAAVLAAALWALHPLFVSTALYVVQREAILPATCALVGLLLWLHGRNRFERGRYWPGAALVLLGVGGFTLLGTLAKANGALLPLYVLLIEYLLLRRKRQYEPVETALGAMRIYRFTLLICAWVPAALICGYLLVTGWNGLVHGIGAIRPWTLGERLLTEPRILFDYLRLLWLPRPFTSGLFNEQIHVSGSLWTPRSTLPAILGLFGLIIFAWRVRWTWPAISLAILFFMAGQLLESSTIALELYYEHRNYVPALLMFWPLALWLCGLSAKGVPIDKSGKPEQGKADNRPQAAHRLKLTLALALPVGLATMTHANANLWGDTSAQALMWARLNPQSPRAQANAAQIEMANGQPHLAIARLLPFLIQHPDEVQIAFNLLGARCMQGGILAQDLVETKTALSTTHDPGTLLVSWADRAIDIAREKQCQGFDFVMLEKLFDSGLKNPYFAPGRRQDILHIRGAIALAQHNADEALWYFNAALSEDAYESLALDQAAEFGAAGYPDHGLRHLAYYNSHRGKAKQPTSGMARIHDWVLRRQGYWEHEQLRLQTNLRNDKEAQLEKAARQ